MNECTHPETIVRSGFRICRNCGLELETVMQDTIRNIHDSASNQIDHVVMAFRTFRKEEKWKSASERRIQGFRTAVRILGSVFPDGIRREAIEIIRKTISVPGVISTSIPALVIASLYVASKIRGRTDGFRTFMKQFPDHRSSRVYIEVKKIMDTLKLKLNIYSSSDLISRVANRFSVPIESILNTLQRFEPADRTTRGAIGAAVFLLTHEKRCRIAEAIGITAPNIRTYLRRVHDE